MGYHSHGLAIFLTTSLNSLSTQSEYPDHILQAVLALQSGRVIAYPTEGVWGLGCDPFNVEAVQALLDLKQRPVEKGVILIAADVAQVAEYLTPLTPAQRQQVLASWQPGLPAATWLVPLTSAVPTWISGKHDRVAIRVTQHAQTQALCRAFGGVIVSTSANISGAPAALDSDTVRGYFTDQVLIVEGATGGATAPSTIRDALSGQVIRGE